MESEGVSDLPLLPGMAERMDRPGWRHLLALASRLVGMPKGLSQHPGGMLVSSAPLTDLMPVQPSAIAVRYVAQWDKDSVDDAGVVKIDLLALGALSQMQQAVRLVRNRSGVEPDLGRIDYRDPGVFDDLERAETVGVFQVESAAQMQTITRMRPRDIYDLALEVAAVRPGVGANGGVAEFLRRRGLGLRPSAGTGGPGAQSGRDYVPGPGGVLGYGCGRIFGSGGRPDAATATAGGRERFLAGASERGVSSQAAERIFGKFNPHYMFPVGARIGIRFHRLSDGVAAAVFIPWSSMWPCSTNSPWVSGIWIR